jgi:aromatic ring-cleaving dioxygenase
MSKPTQPALHHLHVYFDDARADVAWAIRVLASEHPNVASVGRFHPAPVGPHPVRQFQLLASAANLERVTRWLDSVRNGLDVLIHPEIDDDLLAHTELAQWLGQPHVLKLDLFR